MVTYTIQLHPQKDGGYTVTTPALPGCISEGDTLEEAVDNIQHAIRGYLLALVRRKKEIPLEFSKLRQVKVSLHKLPGMA